MSYEIDISKIAGYIQSHAARPAPPTLSLRSYICADFVPRRGLVQRGKVTCSHLAGAPQARSDFFGVSKGLETGWLAAQFLSSY